MINWIIIFTVVIIYLTVKFSIKDRYMYLVQLLISIAILPLAIYLVVTRVFIHNTLSLYEMAAIALSSLVLGILFRISTAITADKKRKLIRIPGQYINLIPIFALLSINYLISYLKVSEKEFFQIDSPERQELLIAFTTIMSIWIVMHVCVLYKYLRGKSTPIVINKT
jgi:hypothetical protein